MERKTEIKLRCWIDVDGQKFFGPGRAVLLQHIHEQGSISKAAKVMGMSYKKAWAMVDDMNHKGKQPYVVLHKGGTSGGGAELTETGKAVLNAFNELSHKLSQTLSSEQQQLMKLI